MSSTHHPSNPDFTSPNSVPTTWQSETYGTAINDYVGDLPFQQQYGWQHSHVPINDSGPEFSDFGAQFVAGGRHFVPGFTSNTFVPLPQGASAQRPWQLSSLDPLFDSSHDWTRSPLPLHRVPLVHFNESNPAHHGRQAAQRNRPRTQLLPPRLPDRPVTKRGVKNPQKHRCQYEDCYERFTRANSLQRHEEQFHKNTRHYHCTTVGCSASNRRRDKIIDHCRKKHNGHMTIIEIDDTIPTQFGCPIRDDCIEMLNQVDRVGTGHGRGRTRASQR